MVHITKEKVSFYHQTKNHEVLRRWFCKDIESMKLDQDERELNLYFVNESGKKIVFKKLTDKALNKLQDCFQVERNH